MPTNAELTEENDRLCRELDTLAEQNVGLLADLDRLRDQTTPAGVRPARAPHRVDFMSAGAVADIEQAQARIRNDATLTEVLVTDAGPGIVFRVTEDDVQEVEAPSKAVSTEDVAQQH